MIDQAWQAYTDLEARYARAHDLRHQVCPLSQWKPPQYARFVTGAAYDRFVESAKARGVALGSLNSTGLTLASQYGGAQRRTA